jgi:superfamily II DNA or RNA helicase
MTFPDRLRSYFRESTVRGAIESGDKLQVRKPLFFRSAFTAQVMENERRTYTAVAVVEDMRLTKWRCTCAEDLRPGDLCRHIAKLLLHASDGGEFINERYQSSVWRAVAFSLFSERKEPPTAEEDARDKMLRNLVMTQQEQDLVKRGSITPRVAFESSPWFLWSRERFVENPTLANVTLVRNNGQFFLRYGDIGVVLTDHAVEGVIDAGGIGLLRSSGFEVREAMLTPTFRVELTPDRELKFIPFVIDWKNKPRLRAGLERFGKWFFVDDTFATVAKAEPMFSDRSGTKQGLLFDPRPVSGLPYERETIIEESGVLRFIETHRETLASMRDDLVPDVIRNARPVRLDDEVLFEFARAGNGLFDVRVSLKAGDESITAAEIAAARRDGIRALNRGAIWIDVADSQFAWSDHVRIAGDGHMILTKLEYFRIRGSLRGKAVYRGPADLEAVFRLFEAADNTGDAPSSADLGMDLYGYQQTGYRWLWNLQANDFGALLCDDMGLGKTHQAMAIFRALSLRGPRTLPCLVVCPTSLLDHWRDKLAQYAPSFTVDVHRGGGRAVRSDADIVVTSYGVIRSDLERFRKIRWDLVVADEIQAIKNKDTATHQALRAIERRAAIGLTGTPIENHTGELAALLDFVVPGYLPKDSLEDGPMLRRLVKPFVLRRTKSQVLTELPPKIVDKRYCELLPEQMLMYKRVLDSRGKGLREAIRSGARLSYVHVFAALNYLKQICNHPLSVSGEFAEDAPSGKWNVFAELLEESLSSGLKVVVFSQYLPMLRIIEKHLEGLQVGYASIKGETRDRGREIRRFHQDPDCRVFTASLKAGGLGIDLTAASVVIHYDRWWNQAREDQATDRVHRLGQNNGVQVIKLITRGTLEEKIDLLIERKAALAASIITEDDPTLVKQFTPEELDELLEF